MSKGEKIFSPSLPLFLSFPTCMGVKGGGGDPISLSLFLLPFSSTPSAIAASSCTHVHDFFAGVLLSLFLSCTIEIFFTHSSRVLLNSSLISQLCLLFLFYTLLPLQHSFSLVMENKFSHHEERRITTLLPPACASAHKGEGKISSRSPIRSCHER